MEQDTYYLAAEASRLLSECWVKTGDIRIKEIRNTLEEFLVTLEPNPKNNAGLCQCDHSYAFHESDGGGCTIPGCGCIGSAK